MGRTSGLKLNSIAISRLRAKDAPVYRGILVEALIVHPEYFAADYSEEVSRSAEAFAERMEEETILGAWKRDELVGIVSFVPQPNVKRRHVGTIWNMYVKEHCRNKKVGELLLQAVLDEAKQRVDQVELLVAQGNKVAARFYEKFGFQTYGVMPRALRVENRDIDARMMVLRFR